MQNALCVADFQPPCFFQAVFSPPLGCVLAATELCKQVPYTLICGSLGRSQEHCVENTWLPRFLSLSGPGSWESLDITWVLGPGWGLAGRGKPGPGSTKVVSECSLLFPRMSGDVSSQVFHMLARDLRPASRVCHTLH